MNPKPKDGQAYAFNKLYLPYINKNDNFEPPKLAHHFHKVSSPSIVLAINIKVLPKCKSSKSFVKKPQT